MAAALQAVERGGEAGLSMRGLAATLGISAKLLYSYVRDKDELIDLANDAVLVQWELPDESLPWQERFTALVQTGRRLVLRFPGLSRRPLLRSLQSQYSPNIARVVDALKACLTEAGMSPTQADQMLAVYEALLLGELVLYQSAVKAGTETSTSRAHIDAGFEAGISFMIKGIESSKSRRRDG